MTEPAHEPQSRDGFIDISHTSKHGMVTREGRLLAPDIPVVEHLCGLFRLPERGSRFFAVPVTMSRVGTVPVHAFTIV